MEVRDRDESINPSTHTQTVHSPAGRNLQMALSYVWLLIKASHLSLLLCCTAPSLIPLSLPASASFTLFSHTLIQLKSVFRWVFGLWWQSFLIPSSDLKPSSLILLVFITVSAVVEIPICLQSLSFLYNPPPPHLWQHLGFRPSSRSCWLVNGLAHYSVHFYLSKTFEKVCFHNSLIHSAYPYDYALKHLGSKIIVFTDDKSLRTIIFLLGEKWDASERHTRPADLRRFMRPPCLFCIRRISGNSSSSSSSISRIFC